MPSNTNPSASDIASAAKMSSGQIIGNPAPSKSSGVGTALAVTAGLTLAASIFSKKKTPPGETKFTNKDGTGEDLRVKIRVPADPYLSSPYTSGSNPMHELEKLGGIVFPYTPTISYEHKADYSNVPVMHSNFAINFYQRSYITNIGIAGKFTVQNDKDAGVYLSTITLLRALTKMRSGDEAFAGSPPPVCRLDAYGEMMLKNVPVAISSFKIELPDSVDYYTIDAWPHVDTSVPTISTISITCIPMYSRREMQEFTVSGWLASSDARKKGIL
jgi:hypothetical protein